MSQVKEYVCGFLFDSERMSGQPLRSVLLIKKTKPEWQKGRYNGIGGKIEEGETPLQAMQREFLEETGIKNGDIEGGWLYFAKLSGNDTSYVNSNDNTTPGKFVVHFFKAFANPYLASSTTEEEVDIFAMDNLPNILPNLRWLLPLAIDVSGVSFVDAVESV